MQRSLFIAGTILLLCGAAPAEEPQGLLLRKGAVKWEMTLTDARKLVEADIRPNTLKLLRDQKQDGFGCERGGQTGVVVCNWACCVDLGLPNTVHFARLWFLNDRFYAYDVAFGTAQFPDLYGVLVKRLGEPSKQQQDTVMALNLMVQGMGGNYIVSTKQWDLGATVVQLADRGGLGNAMTGHIYVAYLPLAREAAPPAKEDTAPRAKLPF